MKIRVLLCFLVLCFNMTLASFADDVMELTEGYLKLKVFGRTGSFCLYQLSTNGKNNYVPLYSDIAFGQTNKFSVWLDGKIYRLERKLGRPIKLEKINDEILITFNIKDRLYIVQHLKFVPDEYGNTKGHLLKIVTTIENTQNKEANVALRAIFDTSLGEHAKKAPLSTDLRESIASETSFDPKIVRDSVIISSNKDSACMFFFKNGVDIPEQVYIANWERMHPRKWLPKVVEGRNFNSKYLHNDSACLFIWPNKELKPTEVMSITTAIGYHDFIRSAKGYTIQSDTTGGDEIKKIYALPKEEAEDEMLKKIDIVPENRTKEEIPTKKHDEPPILKPTLEVLEEQKRNYDYIQELLNKIHAVEKNPDGIDDKEIEMLTDQAESAIKDIEENK